jgi:hypothetical protein
MKHRLYLKSTLKLEQLAEEINRVALSGFTRYFRDGLNRGGGYYCGFLSEMPRCCWCITTQGTLTCSSPRVPPSPITVTCGLAKIAAHVAMTSHGIDCAFEPT